MTNNKDDFDKIVADDTYGLCPAPINAQKALDVLCDYLLGDDFYIADPISTTQANTVIVQQILFKYSKEYRKRFKKLRKECNDWS